jgi:hypothetical protein
MSELEKYLQKATQFDRLACNTTDAKLKSLYLQVAQEYREIAAVTDALLRQRKVRSGGLACAESLGPEGS